MTNLIVIEDLREIASNVQIDHTQDVIDYIEKVTNDQHSCHLWYKFRIGRVTGSTLMKVCRTTILAPAISTIERICHPERNMFQNAQVRYGKEHEVLAREEYVNASRLDHTNFSVEISGFVINNEYPFCGVSPDGIIRCSCCGFGALE